VQEEGRDALAELLAADVLDALLVHVIHHNGELVRADGRQRHGPDDDLVGRGDEVGRHLVCHEPLLAGLALLAEAVGEVRESLQVDGAALRQHLRRHDVDDALLDDRDVRAGGFVEPLLARDARDAQTVREVAHRLQTQRRGVVDDRRVNLGAHVGLHARHVRARAVHEPLVTCLADGLRLVGEVAVGDEAEGLQAVQDVHRPHGLVDFLARIQRERLLRHSNLNVAALQLDLARLLHQRLALGITEHGVTHDAVVRRGDGDAGHGVGLHNALMVVARVAEGSDEHARHVRIVVVHVHVLVRLQADDVGRHGGAGGV
jgi:hypothetical protein